MNRRPYVRPVSKTTWYMRHGRYRRYMFRELTCVLVAVYCLLILTALVALMADTPDRWQAFLAGQQHTGWLIFHVLSLLFFTVYQTIDWFKLAPKAMPLQLGGWSVPPGFIIAVHYLGWFIASAVVLWLTGVI